MYNCSTSFLHLPQTALAGPRGGVTNHVTSFTVRLALFACPPPQPHSPELVPTIADTIAPQRRRAILFDPLAWTLIELSIL